MRKVEPYALTAISGYEFLALTTGLVPTITSLVRHLPRLVRHGLGVAAGIYLIFHFDH